MRNTVALVLAGGINLGFSVLTHNRAKSALPFCGHYRVIDFVLTNLSHAGINHVGVMIQFLPGSLIDHIGSGGPWDFDTSNRRIKLMPPFVGIGKTEWFRGSADAVYQNLNFLKDNKAEDVLVLCADHVYCMDYRPLLEFHRNNNANVTILTTKRPDNTAPNHYGYVTIGNTGRVQNFVEKPETPPHDVVSTGIYLFKADVLCERLEEMQHEVSDHHLPTAVVEPLVREGRAFAYEFGGAWNYLPDLSAYIEAHQRILQGEMIHPGSDSIITNMRDRELGSRPAPYFGPLSDVRDSIISPGCKVEGTVIRSVLSPGVHIGPKAVVCDSILFHDCTVQEGANLQSVVSDKDVQFDAFCRVGTESSSEKPPWASTQMVVVGKSARICQGVEIDAGHEIPIDQIVTRDYDWRKHKIV